MFWVLLFFFQQPQIRFGRKPENDIVVQLAFYTINLLNHSTILRSPPAAISTALQTAASSR